MAHEPPWIDLMSSSTVKSLRKISAVNKRDIRLLVEAEPLAEFGGRVLDAPDGVGRALALRAGWPAVIGLARLRRRAIWTRPVTFRLSGTRSSARKRSSGRTSRGSLSAGGAGSTGRTTGAGAAFASIAGITGTRGHGFTRRPAADLAR
jgi:hypothetical protein